MSVPLFLRAALFPTFFFFFLNQIVFQSRALKVCRNETAPEQVWLFPFHLPKLMITLLVMTLMAVLFYPTRLRAFQYPYILCINVLSNKCVLADGMWLRLFFIFDVVCGVRPATAELQLGVIPEVVRRTLVPGCVLTNRCRNQLERDVWPKCVHLVGALNHFLKKKKKAMFAQFYACPTISFPVFVRGRNWPTGLESLMVHCTRPILFEI